MTELTWKERISELEYIASIWTCNATEVMSRTALADPCISIILTQSATDSRVFLRGPETRPRDELLLPGTTVTAIRLQPGVQVKNFSTAQFTNHFLSLPADARGQFTFEGVQLQFPEFKKAEQLIEHMHSLGLITGKALNTEQQPRQGLSSRSYSRLIKRSTGLSPHKLHQLRRVYEALSLLKQGRSATTVAAELGFVDQAHLNRATKQFFGRTPKELLDVPQKP